jgi:hypothetical protein
MSSKDQSSFRGQLPWLLLLALLVGLPALSLIGHPGAFLAAENSELPVKLWGYGTFTGRDFFGGEVVGIGWPSPGPLNNPDPFGTVVVSLLSPLCGMAAAYDLLVLGTFALNLLAAFVLARAWTGRTGPAVVGAACFAFTPLILDYCLCSAITDVFHLWPWLFGIRYLMSALRHEGWRDGVFAGIFFGLGVFACVYNAVIFGAAIIPALLLLALLRRNVQVRDRASQALLGWRRSLRQWGRVAIAVGFFTALLAGPSLVELLLVMEAPKSQMSGDFVTATRHEWPFLLLRPVHGDRFVTWLADYFAIGREQIVERHAASRFLRAFAPGYVVVALALVGTIRTRRTWIWAFFALYFALASAGPYLVVSQTRALPGPWNPTWLALWWLIPGTKLIFEPFRYALLTVLGLSVCAASGTAVLIDVLQTAFRRRRVLVSHALAAGIPVLALFLVLGERVAFSPIIFPLPTWDLQVPDAYRQLDLVLPAGPILELPYFVRGSKIFDRRHFYWQLVHRRPIPDTVAGFLPVWLQENQFTAAVLSVERRYGFLSSRVTDPDRTNKDRDRFAASGLVGIVVDPELYDSPEQVDQVRALLEALGPVYQLDGRMVVRMGFPAKGATPPEATRLLEEPGPAAP